MTRQIYLPKINILSVRKVVIYLSLFIIVFTGGFILGKRDVSYNKETKKIEVNRDLPQDKSVDFSLFWKVWDSLESDYFDKTKIDPQAMVYGAIRGMVSALGDPYTAFLPPEENRVVQEDLSGSFQGVGIQIGFKGSRLAVIAPLPETPADKAGIKAGDIIIGIKDEEKGFDRSTVGITLPEAVQIIRGPKGSIVTLALIRGEQTEPIIIDVKRDSIDVPSVITSYIGDGEDIAHVRLLKFAEVTDSEWDSTVREILKSKVNGIILDLRSNPGGYMLTAVDFAGEFLEDGTLVVVEEYADGRRNEFKTDRFPRLSRIPTVILVDEGSASASEILAAALREQVGIVIIGTKTFGKGTIQEPRQFGDGTSLHITTARWVTPDGNWVNEVGIDPDFEVEDNIETEEDEQLDKAIEELRKL